MLLAKHAAVACVSMLLSIAPAPAPAEDPRVTSTVALTISVGATDSAPRPLTVNLFGDEAPDSVQTFLSVCDGSLPGLPGLSYRGSTITRVEKDTVIVAGNLASGGAQDIERSIDSTGYVRSTLVNRADAFQNRDANGLRHDRQGVVSMQKGGGSFRFNIVPAPNKALDDQFVVIGQTVLDAQSSMLLRDINEVPVRQPKAETSIFLAAGKAGGDPRTRVETVYRPLRKITIVGCEVRPDQ